LTDAPMVMEGRVGAAAIAKRLPVPPALPKPAPHGRRRIYSSQRRLSSLSFASGAGRY
jgi:hypothetical protein